MLAQSTNSGVFEQNEFSTITELGLTFRRRLLNDVTASFGYSFLHWSDVIRANEQVDLGINRTQIPPGTLDGERRPEFQFRSTDFWAHGFNFGLEYLF